MYAGQNRFDPPDYRRCKLGFHRRFDIVAWIFGGQGSVLSRIVYTIVGLCALWCISLLFRSRENILSDGSDR